MKIKLFTFPNILTLCNLLCGAGATVAALRYGDLFWPLVLIVTAAVFRLPRRLCRTAAEKLLAAG